MALAFMLYPDAPYNDFYVDDVRVELVKIRHETNFQLKVYGKAMHKIIEITDRRAEEIMPMVRVSAGDKSDPQRHGVQVAIEAPKRIQVDRGTVYRKKQEQNKSGSK